MPLAAKCVHRFELKNKVTQHRIDSITDLSFEAESEIAADIRSGRMGTNRTDRPCLLAFARRCYMLKRGMNTTPHTLAGSKSVSPSAVTAANPTWGDVGKSTLASRAQLNSTVLSF